MKFFQTIETTGAVSLMLEKAHDKDHPTENIVLEESLHRTIAKDIAIPEDIPNFRRSTVDGYAVKSADVQGATESIPAMLKILGEVQMGETAQIPLEKGTAIYVPTGGMIPEGADTMVMIEYTKVMGKMVLVYKTQAPSMHMVFPGDDAKKGEVLIKKSTKITPGALGVLAASGIYEVPVYQRPTALILSTGDEIVGPGEEFTLGKIRDINSYTIRGIWKDWQGEVISAKRVKDDRALLEQEVEKAIGYVDFVLLSGGSSVGVRDFTKDVIEKYAGKLLFHGLNLKPGKPTLAGYTKGTWLIGLPGHPVSAMHVLHEVIRPYLEAVYGNSLVQKIRAKLVENIASSPGKRTIQPVNVWREEGEWRAIPHYSASSLITQFVRADGVITIPREVEGLYEGDWVEVEVRQ